MIESLVTRLALSSLMLLIAGCMFVQRDSGGARGRTSDQQVNAQLASYEAAMLAMDFDLAADSFAEGGEVSHAGNPPILGREAIRVFLRSFAAFKVLQYNLRADRTIVSGTTARQSGTYAQRVVVPDGRIVDVTGCFEAAWIVTPNRQWSLERMHTSSCE